MKIVEAYDDLDWYRHQRKTAATVTVTLTYDGTTVELDLSDENKAALDARMADLLQVGRETAAKAAGPRRNFTKDDLHRAREYYKAIRIWADANHIMSADGTRPAYLTPAGHSYYPAGLVTLYEEYMKTSDSA